MAYPDAIIDAALARVTDATMNAALKLAINGVHTGLLTEATTASKETSNEWIAIEDSLIDLTRGPIAEAFKDYPEFTGPAAFSMSGFPGPAVKSQPAPVASPKQETPPFDI